MLRVAITGPESTGKSTLAAWLAKRYQTVWVPEFARAYIGQLTSPYALEDIVAIAEGQARLEEEMQPNANKILFCDSDFFVLKIWAEHAFNTYPAKIAENLHSRPYDLHLLMNVDLPWQPDPQREHPHLRRHFLNLYKQELTTAGVNWALISGTEQERNLQAVKVLESQFPELKKSRTNKGGLCSG